MRNVVIFLIEAYQKTISPDHGVISRMFPGGYCKYTPSCSDYTKEAVRKYGSLKGLYKGFIRIFRCNPCSKGGKDLP